jgi:thymidylate synthase
MGPIVGETISEAWEKSIEELLKSREVIPTDLGENVLELNNVVLEIKDPLEKPRISDKYIFDKKFVEDYSSSLLKRYETHTIYDRVHNFGEKNVNQRDYVIERLKDSWYTFRGIVSLWNPEEDRESIHPPCLCLINFFIRHDKLLATGIMRANDAWFAAVPDMISITDLQKSIADELKLEVGKYTHFATSYHIYEHDVPKAIQIFGGR